VDAENELKERLARVRARFAAALDGKIADSFTALEQMAGGAATIDIVVVAHRRLHEMCGLAPTLGFAATGKAARAAETVMRPAAESKRALTPTEIGTLKYELERLRVVAACELQAYSSQA